MPRGVDVPETSFFKMTPAKCRINAVTEESNGTGTGDVTVSSYPKADISQTSPVEVPVLPPFVNRNNTFEPPEYDRGRRFATNDRGSSPPGDKNVNPSFYYDNNDFQRSLPRMNRNQGQVHAITERVTPALDRLSYIVGICDVCGNRKLWQMLIAEFIGTLFLVLVGCGTCIGGWTENYKPTIVQIALSFGITVATLAQAIGHVSGANLNPAVTIGLVICGKCSVLKAFFYIGAQCLGAICGSAILQVITPMELQGNLGLTLISHKLDTVQALFVEALVTFVLVLTVCGVCDELRQDVKGSAPLAIGLSITACHLMAIPYTGSSMNPARSLGPAVITKIWTNHWVYWAGPILGGFVAGFLYNVAFQERPPKMVRQEILVRRDGDKEWRRHSFSESGA